MHAFAVPRSAEEAAVMMDLMGSLQVREYHQENFPARIPAQCLFLMENPLIDGFDLT